MKEERIIHIWIESIKEWILTPFDCLNFFDIVKFDNNDSLIFRVISEHHFKYEGIDAINCTQNLYFHEEE
jgi:hypothetical protein